MSETMTHELPSAHSHGRKFTSTFYGVSWHKSSQRLAVQIRHGK